MSLLRRAWGRFRLLPAGVQALVGVAVLGLYTLGLVLVLAGGDDNEKPEARPLTPLEREVKKHVESGRVPQRDETDVAAFRTPSVTDSRCEGRDCTVTYSIAVPGGGRIELQQTDIVSRIARETNVERLTLKVVRGQPTGPQASPKSVEETPLGVALYETTCDLTKVPDGANLKQFTGAIAAFDAACEFRDVFEAGPGSGPGAPGSGAGGGEE